MDFKTALIVGAGDGLSASLARLRSLLCFSTTSDNVITPAEKSAIANKKQLGNT